MPNCAAKNKKCDVLSLKKNVCETHFIASARVCLMDISVQFMFPKLTVLTANPVPPQK